MPPIRKSYSLTQVGQPFLAVLLAHSPQVSPRFCTPIHKFAQTFAQTPLDAINRKEYLAGQIEPEA